MLRERNRNVHARVRRISYLYTVHQKKRTSCPARRAEELSEAARLKQRENAMPRKWAIVAPTYVLSAHPDRRQCRRAREKAQLLQEGRSGNDSRIVTAPPQLCNGAAAEPARRRGEDNDILTLHD